MESHPILIVEDDVGLSMMLALALEEAKYAVQIAANGAEALDCLERLQPALILLDLRMPVMDGPAFLEALRQRYGTAIPPVIIMTAYRDLEPEVIGLGMPIITKPMPIDLLLRTIAQQLA